MIPNNRRSHTRLACDIPTEIFPYTRTDKIGEGRVLDITLGGLLIKCRTALQKSIPYRLQLLWKDVWIDMDTRVARDGGEDPNDPGLRLYGMVFNATSSQEFRLRPIIQELQLNA